MSYFNEDQRSYTYRVSTLPPERKCGCGWDEKWSCFDCNRHKAELMGVQIIPDNYERPDKYRLPDGRVVGWNQLIAYLKQAS